MERCVITGTGSYIPDQVQTNTDFAAYEFYGANHEKLDTPATQIVQKFEKITGIAERRYVPAGLRTSDIALEAAKKAIADSGIDPETLDQVIVAHNFGDVLHQTIQTDAVPSLANRVKHGIGIQNPNCIAYDILFGCPGWVQALIQAVAFAKAGMGKRFLVIGAETLSRVIDIHDRDSMIFSDGAGACVLEYRETGEHGRGVLSTAALSHSMEELSYIDMGKSFFPDSDPAIRYIKMQGRKVYEYAMTYVPDAMKQCLDSCGVDIDDLKKIFIHQANEKMDEGIVKRFFQLYGREAPLAEIMPMCIQWLGNSSVATIPTLYDLVSHGRLEGHTIQEGDVIMFASVGAGMNINAVCYRC